MEPAASKKIGLIGGLAFRAGVFYYEQILQRFSAGEKRLELVLGHADVRTVMASIAAGDKARLGRYLGTLANELFDAGAQLVAVTAVAPHLAIEEMAEAARGPIVSVLDCVSAELKRKRIGPVAVFGNRAVMETDVFGTIPHASVVKPEPSQVDEVHSIYTGIALAGKRGTQPETQRLEEIAGELIGRGGARTIMLAGTDLSSFYADRLPAYPSVDVARLHIDRIVSQVQGAE